MSTQHLATFCALTLALCFAANARANYVNPYTADANTVVLYHLDENSGSTSAADSSVNGFNLGSTTSPFDGGDFSSSGSSRRCRWTMK